mgnify:CR=1 FL=1
MIRRPPRSTLDRSSAASDVYKRQELHRSIAVLAQEVDGEQIENNAEGARQAVFALALSLIHISEPTRPY